MFAWLANLFDAAAGTLALAPQNLLDFTVGGHAVKFPGDIFQYAFNRRAAAALFLLAPLCATVGTQVVNFRLSFFADAVAHSAFTGLALGMVTLAWAGQNVGLATWFMAPFGVLVAFVITWQRRRSSLSSDTVVGVYSTTTYALGLWVLVWLLNHGQKGGEQAFNTFLRGNVLTVDKHDLLVIALFSAAAAAFLAWSYNRLLLIGLNADLAQTTGVRTRGYEYGFAALLACVVMACVPIVGALVVTALLIVPAAAARSFGRSAGAVFWWGLAISWSSAFGGLWLADHLKAAVGASIVLCSAAWFFAGQLRSALRR